MISEFDLIARYFQGRGPVRDDVVLGIGDDAALMQPPPGRYLVSAVDTLVAGRHFPLDTGPEDIAYKALAVNLSDFAAMGATPAWATLALTLPDTEPDWLQAFADGFFQLAEAHQVALVGGDTVCGPLTVSVQLHGYAVAGKVLRRDAAKPGDALFVSGTLGDAAYALQRLNAGKSVEPAVLMRLNRPSPRVALGQQLAAVAGAAIDISDGLLADLGHIVQASGCGATLWPESLPASPALQALPGEQRLNFQLYGGDDYELCFSLAPQARAALEQIQDGQKLPLVEIGVIEAQPGVRCRYADGRVTEPRLQGYDHFRGTGSE